MYGYQYDAAGTKCSGKAQPGVRVLRDTMDDLVPELGDLGIYNCRPTRGGSSLSLHGEGRAWDCAATGALLIKAGQFFVDAAEMLGIQRVICGFGPGKAPKEWDSRPGQRFWSNYGGPAHDDHDHVELSWDAALHLTSEQVRAAFKRYWPGQVEEDFLAKLTEDEQKRVLTNSDKSYKALFDKVDGVEVNVIDLLKSSLQRIEAKLNEGVRHPDSDSPDGSSPAVTPASPDLPDHTHGAVEGEIDTPPSP